MNAHGDNRKLRRRKKKQLIQGSHTCDLEDRNIISHQRQNYDVWKIAPFRLSILKVLRNDEWKASSEQRHCTSTAVKIPKIILADLQENDKWIAKCNRKSAKECMHIEPINNNAPVLQFTSLLRKQMRRNAPDKGGRPQHHGCSRVRASDEHEGFINTYLYDWNYVNGLLDRCRVQAQNTEPNG